MSSLRPNAAAAKANPNAISVRIKSRDAKGAANQRAHDLRIGRQPNYVDEKRSSLNRHLIPALTAANIRRICEDRRTEADIQRERAVAKNAAVATVGIITFGIQAQKVMALLEPTKQDQLFAEVADAVAKRLGTSVTGLSIHLDESAIHAHFQMPAVSVYGTPVSKIAVKKVLNEIQTIAAQIAGRYDSRIERGTPRLQREAAGAERSETINRQVRQLHDDLPAEIAELRAKADAEQARYEKNKRLADRAAAKAKEEGVHAEKAKKNAAIYEKRAAGAQATLQELDRELSRLEQLRAEISEAETRLAPLKAAMEELDRHEAELAQTADAAAQQNAEAEAARIMFGDEADITTLAILAGGDEIVWEGYGRQLGGWQFEEPLSAHGINVAPTDLTDFRKVREKLEDAGLDVVPNIIRDVRNDDEASEHQRLCGHRILCR
ncbi:plasmid recombination protein [uncultured Roseobacter sp.]|uniref:plasmid recombination protein n=1 Tax=uncultured Roseobacter sp. TaxID=114847 RepID=UPI002631B938|nr:plasmid recombination protein [uncultured Roseobacter sp.]